ncbi:MAG TPA: transglycosylase SLT domain-containing protein [bacterium]|nr:transglycosylase SLT domain-containing protein [bacterium]
MKTAATIVVVLALVNLLHKDKKPEPPRDIQTKTNVEIKIDYSAIERGDVVVDKTQKEKIVSFGKTLYRQPIVTNEVLDSVAENIVKYAALYELDYALCAAFIARESGYNPRAVSRTGAKGLGQLVDSTAREMGVNDPFDIEQNLRGSLGYFKRMLEKWNGYPDQTERALASYLVGPRTVENYGGVPNSSKKYIADIMQYREKILGM